MTTRVGIVYGLGGIAAAVLLALGEWTWCLAVLAGLLIGWGLSTPTRRTYTIFAIAFLVPVTTNFGYPTYPSWTILAALFVIGVGTRLAAAPREGWNLPVIGMALLIPTSILVASLFSWRGLGPLAAAVAPWACYGVIGWHVVEIARRDPAAMRRIAKFFSWVGVFVAALAFYQRMTGRWPILDTYAINIAFEARSDPLRSAGTMGHPLVYGAFAMGMACVALGLRFKYWRVAFIANMVGLIFSGTRSAWGAMLCALLLWYIAQPRKLSLKGVATTIGSAAAAYGVWKLGPPVVVQSAAIVAARVDNVTESESAHARYERSGTAMQGISDNLYTGIFGHGPEGHVHFFRTVGIHDGLAQAFDNTYLTMWYNSGVIGLAALIVVLATLLLRYRSLTGRMILGAFTAQILFFDFTLWPCAAAVALIGLGLAVADAPDGRMLPIDRDTLRVWDPAVSAGGGPKVGALALAPGRSTSPSALNEDQHEPRLEWQKQE